jgi:hypothetical protein
LIARRTHQENPVTPIELKVQAKNVTAIGAAIVGCDYRLRRWRPIENRASERRFNGLTEQGEFTKKVARPGEYTMKVTAVDFGRLQP